MPRIRRIVSHDQLPITLRELENAGAKDVSQTKTADGMIIVEADVPDAPAKPPLRRAHLSLRFGGLGDSTDSP